MAEDCAIYSAFVKELKEKDSTRVKSFEADIAKIADSMVTNKCGKWLKVIVQLDGISPPVQREVLVNPEISMQCPHDQVLCPAMGWKSNYHSYAFRKMPSVKIGIADALQVMEDACWIGPKVELE